MRLLTKWAVLAKGNLEYQWPLWGVFEILKLNFFKARFNYSSSKISRPGWNAYFVWYFGASQHYQESPENFRFK